MSRLLWFLIGSVTTLVAGAIATNYMDDADGPGKGSPSAPENNENIGEENPAEAG